MAKQPTQLTTEITAPAYDDLLVVQRATDSVVSKMKIGRLYDTGWNPLGYTPDTITANGNGSYNLVFNSVDLSTTISPKMRFRMTRTTTAPTLCTDLNGTNQYYSDSPLTGMTFTDDFVVSAHIKLDAIGSKRVIASRYNGTSGWELYIDTTGQIVLRGYNASAANYSQVASVQAVVTGEWTHIAAQLDMSAFTATTTTSYIMVNGVDAAAVVTRGGTNPTALVQAGNLNIGASNAASFFDGKLAQVAIYSAKVTQATILASIDRTLVGTETSIISAYSFNNVFTDLNTINANNLTANGSAVATATDSPFAGGNVNEFTDGTTEMGIVQTVTFSTNTTAVVQAPKGYAIPTTGGLSAVYYSMLDSPLGFPSEPELWTIDFTITVNQNQTSASASTIYNPNGIRITPPIGSWKLSFEGMANQDNSTSAGQYTTVALSTSSSSYSDYDLAKGVYIRTATTSINYAPYNFSKNITLSAATTYYGIIETATGGGTISIGISGSTSLGNTKIRAVNNYL